MGGGPGWEGVAEGDAEKRKTGCGEEKTGCGEEKNRGAEKRKKCTLGPL